MQFIAPKGFHHKVMKTLFVQDVYAAKGSKTFWRYELQNVETQNALTLTFQERCATVLSDVFKTMARKRFIHEFMEEDGRV